MISVVISYSSNERRFFDKMIEECLKFSDNIIVSCLGRFFDGEIDKGLIEVISKEKSKNVGFVVDDTNEYQTFKDKHNGVRWNAIEECKYEHILFLDGDEIPDGDLMKKHLERKDYEKYHAISFQCYWYFREQFYRAKTLEECGVIIKKHLLTKDFVFHESERWNFTNVTNNYLRNQKYNGEIIMHHYSWVRTKEEMLRKVKAWGHTNDKDWNTLIEEEFSREFNGKDFVHGYNFEILKEQNLFS
jgi:hypothetical protein